MDINELYNINGNIHYIKRYIRFINSIHIRGITKEQYTEKHHILPRSMFPKYENLSNFPDNSISLSLKEHYIAHWILARAYGGSMWFAFNMMTSTRGIKMCSSEYEELRRNFRIAVIESITPEMRKQRSKNNYIMWNKPGFKESRSGENHPLYGVGHTKETAQKISITKKELFKNNPEYKDKFSGKNNGMYGKTHTEETKKLIGEHAKRIHTGKVVSEKTKKLLSEINTGKLHSQETKDKISKSSKGRYWPEERKKKLSDKMKGRVHETISCLHCGKSGSKPNIVRWHNDNCKHKDSVNEIN